MPKYLVRGLTQKLQSQNLGINLHEVRFFKLPSWCRRQLWPKNSPVAVTVETAHCSKSIGGAVSGIRIVHDGLKSDTALLRLIPGRPVCATVSEREANAVIQLM